MSTTDECSSIMQTVLMESHEWTGWWWVPESPDRRVPGTLRCTEGDRPTLSLIDGFDGLVFHSIGGSLSEDTVSYKTWPAIVGDADGTEITLLDCAIGSFGSGGQQISGMYALVGALLAGPDAAFRAAVFEIEHLTMWSGHTGITRNYNVDDSPRRTLRSIDMELPEMLVAVARGCTYKLTWSFRSPGWAQTIRGGRCDRVEESCAIRVESDSEPMGLSEVQKRGKELLDLITLATGRPAGYLKRTLLLADEGNQDGRRLPAPSVTLYSNVIAKPDREAPAVSQYNMLFSVSDIDFSAFMPRWLEVREKCETTCNMVAGMHYKSDIYLESKVVTIVSAAEAMHQALDPGDGIPQADLVAAREAAIGAVPENSRQWVRECFGSNTPRLKQRLVALASRLDPNVLRELVPNTDRWAKLTKDARNDLAHNGRWRENMSVHQVLAVVEVTMAIVKLVLLAELGLGADVQARVVHEVPRFQGAAESCKRHLS